MNVLTKIQEAEDLIRINNRRLNELEYQIRTEAENIEYEQLKEI